MTDDDLKAIEARANAASKGPWTWRGLCDSEGYDELRSPAKPFPDEPIVETDSECYGPREPDAEFIAHARTDVPALVAEVRDMRWVLGIIGAQQDGAWGNFARMALDGTMKIAATRERWEKAPMK